MLMNNEFENGGEISGFDSVNEPENNSAPEPNEDSGYTVTPEGGFYTRRKDDIIQDEALTETKTEPQQSEKPKTDFRPNGSYGTYTNNSYSPKGTYQYNPYTGAPVSPKPAPTYQKPKKKRQYSAAVVIAASVLAAIIGAVCGVGAVIMTNNDTQVLDFGDENTGTTNVSIEVDEEASSVAEAVNKKASISVVGIRTTTSVISFFGGNDEQSGEGSGVVYSSDGYIITNYHVVESVIEAETSAKIEVFIGDKNSDSYEATVIGYNISSDLAVLKINAKNLTPVELGNSDELQVGQRVVTIGCPGGIEFMGSVTSGIISGLNREVSSAVGVPLIQTDAAINPGNSGGALLNEKGQLIGINSSKIVSTEYEGMGFSIPVNTVVERCNRIIEKQNEPEPYIGISISEKYTAEVLGYYGFPTGAVVLSVDSGSPAEEAGIKRGDIITEFNGTKITTYKMLGELLMDCDPDKAVTVKIYRNGNYYSTKIKVASNTAQ